MTMKALVTGCAGFIGRALVASFLSMTMKALVTGCAGFIGRALVASFLS
jgi:nucleoside-diphosphate-sugar epimerase